LPEFHRVLLWRLSDEDPDAGGRKSGGVILRCGDFARSDVDVCVMRDIKHSIGWQPALNASFISQAKC
jgi:hypothetical protein